MKKVNIEPDFVFSPQPAYIVGTKNKDNTANFCLVTWLGFSVDRDPCIMMTKGGNGRTIENILRENKFSANLVTEETLWLADYFGSVSGKDSSKNEVEYQYKWGDKLDVPILEQSSWVYECKVKNIYELDDSRLILAKIENIQIDEEFKNMDMKMIDLKELRPIIYAPYQYFSIGESLGQMGDWEEKI